MKNTETWRPDSLLWHSPIAIERQANAEPTAKERVKTEAGATANVEEARIGTYHRIAKKTCLEVVYRSWTYCCPRSEDNAMHTVNACCFGSYLYLFLVMRAPKIQEATVMGWSLSSYGSQAECVMHSPKEKFERSPDY